MKIIEVGSKLDERLLNGMVEIHSNAYDDNHFTSLFSKDELIEYYSSLVSNSSLTLVAVEKDSRVLGFAISGENVSRGVNEFVNRNKVKLIIKLLKSPSFFLQKLKAVLKSKLTEDLILKAKFRLLSIAVDGKCQSSGIGAKLLSEIESKLLERNVDIYGLSVRTKNIKAINFYVRNGFEFEEKHKA